MRGCGEELAPTSAVLVHLAGEAPEGGSTLVVDDEIGVVEHADVLGGQLGQHRVLLRGHELRGEGHHDVAPHGQVAEDEEPLVGLARRVGAVAATDRT